MARQKPKTALRKNGGVEVKKTAAKKPTAPKTNESRRQKGRTKKDGRGATEKLVLRAEKVHWTKDGRRRPKRCNQYLHAYGCRPGRPLCRWRRREIKATCWCPAYAYPHRRGSGYCGHPERMWEEMLAAQRDAAERADIRLATQLKLGLLHDADESGIPPDYASPAIDSDVPF